MTFIFLFRVEFIILLIQVVEDGYEFFAKRQLVTLFSAPNYCGEFDNAGAMMSVDETLMCSFQVGSSLRVLAVLWGVLVVAPADFLINHMDIKIADWAPSYIYLSLPHFPVSWNLANNVHELVRAIPKPLW